MLKSTEFFECIEAIKAASARIEAIAFEEKVNFPRPLLQHHTDVLEMMALRIAKDIAEKKENNASREG